MNLPEIKPVTRTDLVRLLGELVHIHGVADVWEADLNLDALLEELGNQTIRTDIRATLEALDMRYLYHEVTIPEAVEFHTAALEEDESCFSSAGEDEHEEHEEEGNGFSAGVPRK